MGRQSINLPSHISHPLAMRLAPNDSGIKRGDRDDTGENEARLTETGTGPALTIGDIPSDAWADSTEPTKSPESDG